MYAYLSRAGNDATGIVGSTIAQARGKPFATMSALWASVLRNGAKSVTIYATSGIHAPANRAPDFNPVSVIKV
jgi:hypothetical protein